MERKQRKHRSPVTQAKCSAAKKMSDRGVTNKEIGEVLDLCPSTISKLKKHDFILEAYLEGRKESNKIQRGIKTEPEAEQEEEKPIPGQIEMELVETKPQEMSDQVKMMRFVASQADKLSLKLDHLNDTLSMILRVLRKE